MNRDDWESRERDAEIDQDDDGYNTVNRDDWESRERDAGTDQDDDGAHPPGLQRVEVVVESGEIDLVHREDLPLVHVVDVRVLHVLKVRHLPQYDVTDHDGVDTLQAQVDGLPCLT